MDSILADYSIALFNGRSISNETVTLKRFDIIPPLPEVMLSEYCWICAVGLDPHKLAELAATGWCNPNASQIMAQITIDEYDRSITELRRLSIYANETESSIRSCVWSICLRFGIVEDLKKYARVKLMGIYNASF